MKAVAGKTAGSLARPFAPIKVAPIEIILAVFLFAAGFLLAPPTSAQNSAAQNSTTHPKKSSATSSKKAAATSVKKDPAEPLSPEAREKQLTRLSRALQDNSDAAAYDALAAFATQNSKNELGARAALALGHYDLSRNRAQAALDWLKKAEGDKVLTEYVRFWQAQAALALGQREDGLAQLQAFRRDFPDSVMTEQVVALVAQTALALGKAEDAVIALDTYPSTSAKPWLLLLRAQSREKLAQARGDKPLSAAVDYLDLYYRFSLTDQGKAAGDKILSLQLALGESFPGTPTHLQIARAESFYIARRWREARAEYAALLPKLSGADHDRAELRIAQCDVAAGRSVDLLNGMSLADPELEAERLYAISQIYRTQKRESDMLDQINQLAQRFPHSPWTAQGLFATGNYYWVTLDRAHASEFYRRMLEASADGADAPTAAWRIAWTAYLGRQPEGADLIEAYVRQFPTSKFVQDALYWLGRSYERSGDLSRARTFYMAAATRFPLTYFGSKAAGRVRPAPDGIGASPAIAADFLSVIPAAPALMPWDQPLLARTEEYETRAHALSEIAFDASAEREYRAAYAVTPSPKLLVYAAEAAIASGHYASGMSAARQAFPQLEARAVADLPNEAWRTVFPLPYESSLRSAAIGNELDAMLIAGLVRQESAFASDAISRAGAVGLMQVMPKTGAKLAKQLKIRYVRARLTEPGYNLQLGSHYLAGLIQAMGTSEGALAAYNAGEDRVAQWTAGQNYLEAAEFVESIPFTETRDYVQIVIRNADVYRQVYGKTDLEQTAVTEPARKLSTKAPSSHQGTSSRQSTTHRTARPDQVRPDQARNDQ